LFAFLLSPPAPKVASQSPPFPFAAVRGATPFSPFAGRNDKDDGDERHRYSVSASEEAREERHCYGYLFGF